ncbi:MAG TPA: glycosyltransferase family 1 protein [Patescibacteria group bacterium]|nr:glycosyltransferase family 1 protein [Patescibacteria group bacterium]
MIIGIDTRIPTKNKTGVGYILNNILPYIVRFDKNIKFFFLGEGFGIKEKNVMVLRLPRIIQRGFNFLWKYVFFPSARILIGKTNSFFFSNFVDFPVNTKKRILLIPDLSYIKYPQFSEKKNLQFLKRYVGSAVKRSNKVLTISENAKKEIIEYYGISQEKVEVVYLGCPEDIKKITDNEQIEKVKTKYGILGSYLFFVGTLEPRKNIEGIIKAYNILPDDLQNKYKLVISGGKGWYYDKIFSTVEKLNLNDKVVFTGYVSELDKSCLYSGASLFVFPSFYEGFGMPILEAFKCGVPVVTADNSSLREVGGDAALYCVAEDIESIKVAIERIIINSDIREDLIQKGYKQLEKFSWESSAKKIFNILNS